MNQNFSFKRYVWLLKRQWIENATIYKWGIVLMVLVPDMLFWIIKSWEIYHPNSLSDTESVMIAKTLFLYIFGASFFNNLALKNKKMFYFSLPVSTLEKVAVAFTFVMVFMPVLYSGIFTLSNLVSAQLFDHIHGTSFMYSKLILPFQPLFFHSSLCCIFALGSLMFGKKGSVLSILFIIAFFSICILILKWLHVLSVSVPKNLTVDVFVYLIPFWWVLMYFVMKRKEA